MSKTVNVDIQKNTTSSDLVTKSDTPSTIIAGTASNDLATIQYIHANINITDPNFRGYKITNIS
jgi:hypothetical protein